MPLHWDRFEVALKRPGIDYLICVDRVAGAGAEGIELDGVDCPDGRVPFRADGLSHVIRVSLD
jgi:hypothetical protein